MRSALLAALLLAPAIRVQAQPTPAPTAPPTGAASRPATTPSAQVAVVEFQVEGDDVSPALAGQLEESFVAGLTRSGHVVLDSVDVARRLSDTPELRRCETSICLKQLGQRLGVAYVARVKANVAGNSYKFAGRLFETTGATPAVVPVESQSRFCDVCTVAEARETLTRLSDALRRPIAAPVAAVAPPPPAPPAPPPSKAPWIGVATGLAAVVAGGLLLSQQDSHEAGVLAGGLLGFGLTTAAVSTYVVSKRPDPAPPARTVAFTFSF